MATPNVPLDPANVQPPSEPQATEWADQPLDNFFDPNTPPSTPQAQPTPQPDEWFLEAPTGTRYRTPQEAVAGIAEKDKTISQYKETLAQLQNALQGTSATPRQPTAVDVLDQAVQGDPQLFDQYINQLVEKQVQTRFQAQLNPLQALIGHASMNLAIEQSADIDPNIPTFVRSDAFKQVLKEYPLIKDAVKQARENPMAAAQLPGILHIAYGLSGTLKPTASQQRQIPPSTSTPPFTTQNVSGVDVLDIPLTAENLRQH